MAVSKRFVDDSDPRAYRQLLVLVFWGWMVSKALVKGYAESFAHVNIHFARRVAEVVVGVLLLKEADARDTICFGEAVKR